MWHVDNKIFNYKLNQSQGITDIYEAIGGQQLKLSAEEWLSGLRRTLGKRVGSDPSQVQILSPPHLISGAANIFYTNLDHNTTVKYFDY